MAQKRNIVVSVITQAVVIMVLLAAAGGIFAALWMTKPKAQVSDDPPTRRRVEAMYVSAVPVHRQWTGFGTAAATDCADVPCEVSAVVVDLPRDTVVGTEVNQGDVLAELDKTDFVQQVDITAQRIAEIDAQLDGLRFEEASLSKRVMIAEKETELAGRELQRVLDAFERKGAKEREIDRAQEALNDKQRLETIAKEELDKIKPRRAALQAQRLGLEAQLVLAKKNVERCTIRSPLAGVIQTVDVEIGELLGLGQRVARVVNLRRMEVPLRLPASARAAIGLGDEVTLTSQGAGIQTWPGQVSRIAPEDDEATRTMAVYVDLEQDPHDAGLLAPGKFVQGTVVSSRTQIRSVVPRRSLLDGRLLLIEDNRVRSHPVRVAYHVQGEFPQLGVMAEQWAVLAEPLPEGALVVVSAARSLPEGIEVEVIPLNGKVARGTPHSARGAGR